MKPTTRPALFAITVNLAIIIFAVVLGIVRSKTGNPSRYFGEGRFTTGISCFQLLLTAFFAARIFSVRRAAFTNAGRNWLSGPVLWLLISAGFVFLAADDAFKIHERLDGIIHSLFHLKQTALTDRLDDAIIALYGLIGIGVLWAFRHELRPMRVMLPPLIAGFAFLAANVFFDTLSDKEDILLRLVGDLRLAKRLQGWSDVGDGACTLMAEGLFAAAFYLGWKAVRREPAATA